VHFWPLAITFCAEGYVSCKRVREFLLMKENKSDNKKSMNEEEKNGKDFTSMKKTKRLHNIDNSSDKIALKFKNVTATWVSGINSSNAGLSELNLEIMSGNFIAIIGSVGSGKSSFLQAILGELEIDDGELQVNGSLSYANQENFIFEGSIKSNVLFTEDYDEKRYNEVISVCGLKKDLEIFEHGDETLVGEKGISLSGGQKARINLARAVYKEADIYLLDDPLSAVDSHVGKNIFRDCIEKFLKNKTVLLVTHQIQHLNKLENIVVIENGKIAARGSFEDIKKLELPILVPLENSQQHEKTPINDEKVEIVTPDDDLEYEEQEGEKEGQEVGSVGMRIYKKYFSAVKSLPLVIFVLLLRVGNQAIASFIDFFVAQWVNWEESITTAKLNANITNNEFNDNDDETRQNYINFYIFMIVIFIVTIIFAEFSFFYALIRASRHLHDMMFQGISKTYMRFFNQNPSGRILNRFSKDIGSIDTQLPNTMFECIVVSFYIFILIF
jgi:ATP-binding cassette, subfamily C (CFTR/MRP), member 4